MKEKFDIWVDTCVPLPQENIDTDQIIPARYLKGTDKEGLGAHLFHDLRYKSNGEPDPAFVLNGGIYKGSILVAGNNFGSGSSREHAAWALADYGFRAVISSSIADIHRNNELNSNILPVVVSAGFLARLFETLRSNPAAQVKINLRAQTVINLSTRECESFEIDAHKKHCLLNGLDEVEFLLSNRRAIEDWEREHNPKRRIEILDTTLRDGEQTDGVSFAPHEKLMIAKLLLEDVGVDRIEVGCARVSQGEEDAVRLISFWARRHERIKQIEVLGFVDKKLSPDWIKECGGEVMNLLAKGSLKHCEEQLGVTAEKHLEEIRETITYAHSIGLSVNLYLEDWSEGIKESPQYVFHLMDNLQDMGIKHFILADTLGIFSPMDVERALPMMIERYPKALFDFHTHNDYGLALSNVFAAVVCGAQGIHTTINGLGERAGNAPLASVQAILKDHLEVETGIDESKLNEVSLLVESYSGVHIPFNEPIVGDNVFTQVAGVHADGDRKSNLYCNTLLPERFGRTRDYALGKASGKANILNNLDKLGLDIDEQTMKRVTELITELGDKKEVVTMEDLPYIISDILKHPPGSERVKLLSYFVTLTSGLKPVATIKIKIDECEYEESSSGDGQYDAFVRALRKVYKTTLGRKFPMLTNYAVTIPRGGRTDAFVQTVISWSYQGELFLTYGFDADQIEAAIKATIKMLNKIEESYPPVSQVMPEPNIEK